MNFTPSLMAELCNLSFELQNVLKTAHKYELLIDDQRNICVYDQSYGEWDIVKQFKCQSKLM